jgi:hypothetical protein
MSPPIGPNDLGVVNTSVSSSALNQPFPQIYEPFVKGNGVINQSWLQLLIALWNRTGYAPGASSSDALTLAAASSDEVSVANAEQNSTLGLLIHDAVVAEIARLGLDQEPVARSDPMEALLFLDSSAATGADDDCAQCSAIVNFAFGTRVISPNSDFCETTFTNNV